MFGYFLNHVIKALVFINEKMDKIKNNSPLDDKEFYFDDDLELHKMVEKITFITDASFVDASFIDVFTS